MTIQVGRATILIVAALLCGSEAPADAPDLRGRIEAVVEARQEHRARGILGSVRVRTAREDDAPGDLYLVTVREDTRIVLDGADGEFADLQPGRQVDIRITGGIRESYPLQATAREIVVRAAADQVTAGSRTQRCRSRPDRGAAARRRSARRTGPPAAIPSPRR